jgi:hypothetical protein
MYDLIFPLYKGFWTWVYTLNYQEWFLAFVMTVVLGFFLLRGFGSRKDY